MSIVDWSLAFELAVVAALSFWFWLRFRRHRGARILVGVGFVLAGLVIAAVFFNWPIATHILKEFTTLIVLALIVLFQPELRRVLAAIGSQHFRGEAQQQTSEIIEAVVSSIQALQREGYGALIAFEREMSHAAAHDSGVAIDAAVSSELLTTLFYPRTPLHDGGVVIRGSRILTAAAIFPLTQADKVPRPLGLRHRCALGLSEVIDAVVVVLSEETGVVSLVTGGKIERPLTGDALRQRLTEVLMPHAKE